MDNINSESKILSEIIFDKKTIQGALSDKKRTILPFHCIIIALLMSLPLFQDIYHNYGKTGIYILCLLNIFLLLWILMSFFILTKELFHPYILFVISSFLFNTGQAILEVFHLNDKGILGGNYTDAIITKTIFLILVCLSFLHLGVLWFIDNKNMNNVKNRSSQEKKAFRLTGTILIVMAIIPAFLYYIEIYNQVLVGGRISIFQNSPIIGFGKWKAIIGSFIIPGLIITISGIDKTKKHWKLILAICMFISAIYIIVNLLLGERSDAITFLLAILWIFHVSIKKLSWKLLLVLFLIILFVVIPSVRYARLIPGRERNVYETLFGFGKYESSKTIIAEPISEMGSSMSTVADTIELVPSKRNYDYGASYFFGLLTIIPNIMWEIHPSAKHGFLSNWLVNVKYPRIAEAKGGYGFSFFAEAYLNFGWYGAPLFMLLFGILIILIINKQRHLKSLFLDCFVGIMMVQLLYLPRYESAGLFRWLAWYTLIPLMLCKILKINLERGYKRRWN